MSKQSDILDAPLNIPEYIPNDWSWSNLIDCTKPRQWPTISSSELLNHGYAVYGANGQIGYYHEYNHEDETIAITCRGATCGTVNLIPAYAYITGNAMSLDDLNNETTDFHYLYYSLSYRNLSDVVSGSAQPQITREGLKHVQFPCPPLQEQQKIASILTSVDDVIEKTESQISKLQDLKKGMMQELLTKGIGHNEFKDSPVGRIPVGWKVVEVQEIAKVIRGASPRPKGDPRYYGGKVPRLMVADVTRDGKYVTPTIDSLTEEGAKLSRPMPAGSLTIVCSGTVGIPSILKVDSCIHDGFLGLEQISNDCDLEFLYYQFVPLQSFFDSSATHGGIFTNLTTQILKEFLIVIPPIQEQKKISAIMASIDMKLDSSIKLLRYNTNIKSALMQDLLTGKVRVNQ